MVVADPVQRASLTKALCEEGLLVHAFESADAARSSPEIRTLLAGDRTGEPKRAESGEALRESMQRYRALFEQSIDGIYLHALDGAIVDVNRAAADQSGFSKEELLGMTVFDNIEDPLLCREEIVGQWRRWRAGQSFIIEANHRRKDGTVCPVEINTGKVLIGAQELMLAIVRDVTDRKQAEEERRQLEERLQQAQKMEAVGRLAGGVAHDFNNVLCAISGNAELALRDLPRGDALRETLEAITGAAAHAADLTKQLLAFSRKQITSPRLIDLNELVGSLHPMLVRLLGEDILLRTVPGARQACALVDASLLERVVLNLAANARDAMPDGGELVVETADADLDADYCARHVGLEPGAYVLLAVSDTGVGMDAATRAKAFEPFFSTKETGKGTGLGLSMVHGIVEQSGGRIEVYSEPGRGTSFKLYFPRVLEDAEPLARPTPLAPPRGSETVLVVEDERTVRVIAEKFLERFGYTVLGAGSTAEALEVAERHEGPMELLFTDVVMPGMNGRELATRIAALRPGIKTLFTSGYTENIIARHGVLDDGVWFIAKPYSCEALAARVREVLDDPGKR